MYLTLKALHIISVIFWMAGMMYMPRLFVYHSGAQKQGELEKTLLLQESRLLKFIIRPAMTASFISGLALVFMVYNLQSSVNWLWLKGVFLFILFVMHGKIEKVAKLFQAGFRPHSEKFFRIFNEIPAICIVFIVCLVVIKPF